MPTQPSRENAVTRAVTEADSALAPVKVAVCGAGPVGLALAAFLLHRGMPAQSIALIDAKPLAQTQNDPRAIAVSWGSRQLLEQVHGWPSKTTPIEEIHVSRRGRFGRTLIRAQEYGLPALGYVVRYGDLVSALADALGSAPLRSLRPARVTGSTVSVTAVTLSIDGATPLTADVAVQAEGGVFHEQASRRLTRDYQQTAIVARVSSAAGVPRRAFERFTSEGPLALLPQDSGYAMVWCMRPDTAAQIMALEDGAFLAALQDAFGQRVGTFETVSARFSYPLGLNAHPEASARTVSIGNAAQTLHPVAGQGLNLGLRDAAVLASMLMRMPGPEALMAFARHRKTDRRLSVGITDLMARVFTADTDASALQSLLGVGLGVLDGVAPAKRALAEQMMFGWR